MRYSTARMWNKIITRLLWIALGVAIAVETDLGYLSIIIITIATVSLIRTPFVVTYMTLIEAASEAGDKTVFRTPTGTYVKECHPECDGPRDWVLVDTVTGKWAETGVLMQRDFIKVSK